MVIGVVGYTGRLGSQLINMGCVPIEVDIKQKTFKIDLDPTRDVLINCAAVTDVDECETDQKVYWNAVETNGYGVDHLADNFSYMNSEGNIITGKILHISSDYVFAGKRGPYSEDYRKDDDLPTRKMGYAVTKFLGEVLAERYDNIHIIRTTGLYGGVSGKNDFLNLMLDTFDIGAGEIVVTKDLHGNQTYIPHLAEALLMCAERKDIPKVLHIASEEVITRYEFALMIAEVFNLPKEKIHPVKSIKVPGWIAERPKHGGLKVKLAKKLGIPIYTILEGLQEAKNELQRK